MQKMDQSARAQVPCLNCGHLGPDELWDCCSACDGTQRVTLAIGEPIDFDAIRRSEN